MRILDKLKTYDSSMTVDEVIKDIETKQINFEKLDEEMFTKLKDDFNDSYLVRTNNERLFGKTLEVYYIEKIIGKERTTDWEWIYRFIGRRISFSVRDLVIVDITEKDSFGSKFNITELREMKKITKEEFDTYVGKYKSITNELKELLK